MTELGQRQDGPPEGWLDVDGRWVCTVKLSEGRLRASELVEVLAEALARKGLSAPVGHTLRVRESLEVIFWGRDG